MHPVSKLIGTKQHSSNALQRRFSRAAGSWPPAPCPAASSKPCQGLSYNAQPGFTWTWKGYVKCCLHDSMWLCTRGIPAGWTGGAPTWLERALYQANAGRRHIDRLCAAEQPQHACRRGDQPSTHDGSQDQISFIPHGSLCICGLQQGSVALQPSKKQSVQSLQHIRVRM